MARDSIRLSQEVTALYLSSFKDQSLVTRILTLPANVVRDAAHLSIVDSSERKKLEERLVDEMNALEKRLWRSKRRSRRSKIRLACFRIEATRPRGA